MSDTTDYGKMEEIRTDNGKEISEEFKAKIDRCVRGGKAMVQKATMTRLEGLWDQGLYLRKIHRHLTKAGCYGTYVREVHGASRQHGYDIESIATEFTRCDMRIFGEIGEKKLLACVRAKKLNTREWITEHLPEIKDRKTKAENIKNIEGAARTEDNRNRYSCFDPILNNGRFTCKIHKTKPYATVLGLKTKDDKDSFQKCYEEWVRTRPGWEEAGSGTDTEPPNPGSPPIENLLDLYTDGLEGRSAEMIIYWKVGENKIQSPIVFEEDAIPVDIVKWNAAWLPFYLSDPENMIGARLDDMEGNRLWLTNVNDGSVVTKLLDHVMEDDSLDLTADIVVPISIDFGEIGESPEKITIAPGQSWSQVARAILEEDSDATSVSLTDSQGKIKITTHRRDEVDAEVSA